jgi:2-succinyl-6-hydroxy-2,4-cyclohexadiene-1-carboxylate synthase
MSIVHAGQLPWNVEICGHPENTPLALLHGFAGSLRTWDSVLPLLEPHFRLFCIDLPGHGRTPVPVNRDFSFIQFSRALAALLQKLSRDPVMLCGYSMGGRLAMHTALLVPEVIRALALLGASPGIENPGERERRELDDYHVAENIRTKGIEWFVDYWENLPIFATQKELPPEIRERLREARLSGDPSGLAFSLEKFSTGKQDFLLPELHRLTCPLLLLAGVKDTKFCASNRAIAAAAKTAIVHRMEIPNAGHAAHIERPEPVASELINFANLL